MSDNPNDTRSQAINYWADVMRQTDTPFLNMLSKGPNPYARPIIGYTKPARTLKLWRRLYRIVDWPTSLMSCDVSGIEWDECVVRWRPSDWVADKIADRSPQPIYDPDWVMPESAKKVTWGFGSSLPVDPDVIGVDESGEWVRSS